MRGGRVAGFIPASQVSLYRVENLGEFIGQKLTCVVTEANPQRRNLVLSCWAMLEREKRRREPMLSKLEVGRGRRGRLCAAFATSARSSTWGVWMG